jgi:DivIVA domain-containing protein
MMMKQPERPEFATSIRGYDRLQVDDYLDRLIEITADAEERARTAERELEFSRHTTVGPRVGEILELAVQESKELRERVAKETEEMRTTARKQEKEIVARARKAAAETEATAKRTGKQTIARAEATRDQVLGEVEVLNEQKAAILGDLARLQETIGIAVREAGAKSAKKDASRPRSPTEEPKDESAESRSQAAEAQGTAEPQRGRAAR